jgi:hypothetical protein
MSYKQGDVVNVYVDPIAETKLEGPARIIKLLKRDCPDPGYSQYLVKFVGDADWDPKVKRFIRD